MTTLTMRTLSSIYMCLLLAHQSVCVGAVGENFEAEEGTNFSLPCDFIRFNLSYPGISVPFKKVWILPDASVIHDTFIGDFKYTIHSPDAYTFHLKIANVNTKDFGVYHCVMLWNNVNYAMSAIRVGLNEDYPYYKKRLETLQLATIISAVAVGLIFIAIVIAFCIWKRRSKKSKHEAHDARSLRSTSREPDSYSQQGTSRMRSNYAYDLSHGKECNLSSEGYRRETEDRRKDTDMYATVTSTRSHSDQKEGHSCRGYHVQPVEITAHM